MMMQIPGRLVRWIFALLAGAFMPLTAAGAASPATTTIAAGPDG